MLEIRLHVLMKTCVAQITFTRRGIAVTSLTNSAVSWSQSSEDSFFCITHFLGNFPFSAPTLLVGWQEW